MKNFNLILIALVLLFMDRNLNAQYIPTIEDSLINDVIGDFEPYSTTGQKSGSSYSFYNKLI